MLTPYRQLIQVEGHIYVGNLTIIGSDNGFSPGRRQAIVWINDGILYIIAKIIRYFLETYVPDAPWITPTKYYWLRVFGAPIIYVIPVAYRT